MAQFFSTKLNCKNVWSLTYIAAHYRPQTHLMRVIYYQECRGKFNFYFFFVLFSGVLLSPPTSDAIASDEGRENQINKE